MLRLNLLDRLIGVFSPVAAVRRGHARHVLAEYEGGKPSRLRKTMRDGRSPNVLIQQSGVQLRNHARWLERNHDIARGALDVLVRNVVGPNGVSIEPMPRRLDGSVHQAFADQLMALFRDWQNIPEVTWTRDWAGVQQLMCRSWVRDGEAFAQIVEGLSARLDHGTKVPLSLEMLEADLVPLNFHDIPNNIRQGVQTNDWGRPVLYYVYKHHPADSYMLVNAWDLKTVPAERIAHLALRDRIHQLRGASIFASVINRLEDLKEYEDSERVAAKIAAALTAVIKRNPEMDIGASLPPADPNDRARLRIETGTVFDGAQAGDEITMVDSTRPNPQLEDFRSGQLRAAAGGIGTGYSSLSKNYDGTYSAQRQELVEQWPQYQMLTRAFVRPFVWPVWQRFVGLAVLSGQIKLPADLDASTMTWAEFIGPPMPWIDPVKEAEANLALVRSGFKSLTRVVRERGDDPWQTLREVSDERKHAKELGLTLDSDPANGPAGKPAPGPAVQEPPAANRGGARPN